MNQLKSILVGVDFSDCSRSALKQATRLAKGNNARLHALHCVEYLTLSDAAWASHIPHEKLERDAVAEAKPKLQRWLAEAGAASEAPTKVMLVHEGHTGPFRKVVAGVDFSEQSREAVAQALRVAAQDDSQVHFLHVFTGSWGRYALVPDAWEVDEEMAAQYRHALEQRLREFVGDTAGRPARFTVVEAANHGHGIAEYARRVGADLVVLGTKGRSNLGYVLLGSTVERLLREIPCSALVVRPPEASAGTNPAGNTGQ